MHCFANSCFVSFFVSGRVFAFQENDIIFCQLRIFQLIVFHQTFFTDPEFFSNIRHIGIHRHYKEFQIAVGMIFHKDIFQKCCFSTGGNHIRNFRLFFCIRTLRIRNFYCWRSHFFILLFLT